MDGKNLGSGQEAQQAKPDVLGDQDGLKHTADSSTTRDAIPVNGHDVVLPPSHNNWHDFSSNLN